MLILATLEAEGRTLTALQRDDGHVEVSLGQVPLLTSRALETERLFGALAPAASRRILVGGLGLGATAESALQAAPAAEVIVVERLAGMVELCQGPLARWAAPLDPARARVVVADVAAWLAEAEPGSLDAILLDVDNGPDWASFRSNHALYGEAGLARARRALAPGGLFAVWSGYDKPAFVGSLRRAGFTPSVVPLLEKGRLSARAYAGRA